jgi:hypothetical protein
VSEQSTDTTDTNILHHAAEGEPAEVARAEKSQQDASGRTDPGDIGDRVAAILRAAEGAAAEIRTNAEQESRRVVAGAERTAEARIQELVRDSERLHSEAEEYARDIRLAVEAYATSHRRQAEEEARELLAEAERRAESIRTAAQEAAEQSAQTALRRHEALREETRTLEDRRRTALDALIEISESVRDLLGDREQDRQPDELVDALDDQRRRRLER